jgi:hypothetical protein
MSDYATALNSPVTGCIHRCIIVLMRGEKGVLLCCMSGSRISFSILYQPDEVQAEYDTRVKEFERIIF